jgi:hypothetical protein
MLGIFIPENYGPRRNNPPQLYATLPLFGLPKEQCSQFYIDVAVGVYYLLSGP